MTENIQKEVDHFLDNLRETGITNMYGATPYIEQRFGVNYEEAKQFLVTWMDTYGTRMAHQFTGPLVEEDEENDSIPDSVDDSMDEDDC